MKNLFYEAANTAKKKKRYIIVIIKIENKFFD